MGRHIVIPFRPLYVRSGCRSMAQTGVYGPYGSTLWHPLELNQLLCCWFLERPFNMNDSLLSMRCSSDEDDVGQRNPQKCSHSQRQAVFSTQRGRSLPHLSSMDGPRATNMPRRSFSSIHCLCCPVASCFGWLLCLAGSVTSSSTFCVQGYHRPRPSTTEVWCSIVINVAKQDASGAVLF